LYRRDFMKGWLAVGATLMNMPALGQERRPRPNFLLIIGDDTTYEELSCYGGRNVKTKNIDQLAGEGVLFRRAYTAMAMCVPCRHELYTGLYPLGNGSCWNHSISHPGVKSVCHHLGGLGYRVGLTGKRHVDPPSVFPFEFIEGFEPNCIHRARVSRAELGGIKEFMNRSAEQPFFLAVCLTDSHVPWTTGAPAHFDKEKVVLPPIYPDLPEVRQDYVKYLAEVEELDRIVGEVLNALDDSGKADDTLVLFTSEQGAQWPGAKWTNWEAGLRTGLICRWPGKVERRSETRALVQYADILPTLIDAAGGRAELDGTSFLDVLLGKKDKHRDYAYAMHNNVPEGPPYPIRSVTDGRYRFIRNLLPDAEYVEKHMEDVQPTWHSYWQPWKKAAEVEGLAQAMFRRFRKRPAEELYDTVADTACLENLAERPGFAEVKGKLSQALDAWMKSEEDPGAALDTEKAFRPLSLAKFHADQRAKRKGKD